MDLLEAENREENRHLSKLRKIGLALITGKKRVYKGRYLKSTVKTAVRHSLSRIAVKNSLKIGFLTKYLRSLLKHIE
jgi:hypothetical protein